MGATCKASPSMPVSLSGIIHHSHSFTRLKIYHHIYLIGILLLLNGKGLGSCMLVFSQQMFYNSFGLLLGNFTTHSSSFVQCKVKCLLQQLIK